MKEVVPPGERDSRVAASTPYLREFVRESNRIEGITRAPTKAEMGMHEGFLRLKEISTGQLADFVWTIAKRQLRRYHGMDVRVGDHLPMPGGPMVGKLLDRLCDDINGHRLTPYEAHQAYEHLHPFMDGNGRSGRVLWLWQMLREGRDPYALRRGFLHTFYYQALSGWRADAVRTEQVSPPIREDKPHG